MNAVSQPRPADEKEALERADTYAQVDAIQSLDAHSELVRAILAEVQMLTRKYRNARRHDVPHIAELTGLVDVLWQEVRVTEEHQASHPLGA